MLAGAGDRLDGELGTRQLGGTGLISLQNTELVGVHGHFRARNLMGVVHVLRAVGVFEVDLVRILLQIVGLGNQRILVELGLDDHGDGGAFEDAASGRLGALGLVDVLAEVDGGHVAALVGIGVRSVRIAIASDGNGVDRDGGGQLVVDIIANYVIRLNVRRVSAVVLGINQFLVDGRGGVLQRHRAPTVGTIERGRSDDRDGVGALGVVYSRDILEEPQTLLKFRVLTSLQRGVAGLVGSRSTGLGKFLGQRLGECTQRGAVTTPRAGQLA